MNWKIELNFILSSDAWRLAATKTSGQSNSILVGCRFKNEKSFSDSNDESRLFYILSKTFSVKWPFFEKTLVKWTSGQMTFRSNDLLVKWLFFRKKLWSNVLSFKWPFFGKSFRSIELLVKCYFGHLTSFSNFT
jgi:hypothetical protein